MFVRHLVEHVVHGKRGHQERALRFHQRERFGGGKRAVLDGIHARAHRGFNGARRVGMCRHLHTEHVRGVHRGLHLVFRHQLRMRVVAGGSNATRRHQLDDAGATTLVLAHAKARLFGRIHAAIFPARMAQGRVQSGVRVSVAGRRAQRFQRKPQPRARNLPRLDGVAHRHRFVAAAQVPHGGEALLQHLAREQRCVEGTVESRVCHPVFRGIRAARQLRTQVHVHVDEARQHGAAGEVDDRGARRLHEAFADGGNAVVVDDHRHVLARRSREAVVEEARVDDHVRGGGGERQESEREAGGKTRKQAHVQATGEARGDASTLVEGPRSEGTSRGIHARTIPRETSKRGTTRCSIST